MDKLLEHQLEEEKRLLLIETAIRELKGDIERVSEDVSQLVSAWKAANWLVSLVKWTSGTVVAAVALYNIIRGFKL